MENKERFYGWIKSIDRICDDENKISLYDLIMYFNKLYIPVKKRLNELPEIFPEEEFKDLHFEWYDKFCTGGLLCFTYDSDEWTEDDLDIIDSVYICDREGSVEVFKGTKHTSYCTKHDKKPINKDLELAKEYINIFDNSEDFLNLHEYLTKWLYEPVTDFGSHYVWIEMKLNGNIKNYSLDVSVEESIFSVYSGVKINLTLGDELTINNYNVSYGDEKINLTKEELMDILKAIHVSKKLFEVDLDESKTKKLKNNT